MKRLIKTLTFYKKTLKNKGIKYFIRARFDKLSLLFSYYYYKYLRSLQKFIFQGKQYNYFLHKYNFAWANERTVEIPIILDLINKAKQAKILEVGNVLSHYCSVSHDILDRYEKGSKIINEDVVNYHPSKKYDLILSISTLEHVGWNEKPKEKTKMAKALKNLKKMLSKKGKIIITLPIGYNPNVDKFLKENKICFSEKYYLKRVSKNNIWEETNWDNIKNLSYNYPFPNANGIFIGIIKNNQSI